MLDITKPETFTKQRIFDYVVMKLAEQGKQSTGENYSGCRYRGEGGLKCAVGHLIHDTVYSPIMDDDGGLRVKQLLGEDGGLHHLEPYAQLLDDLQRAHDGCSNPIDFRYWLKEIAKRHGLKRFMACTIVNWS